MSSKVVHNFVRILYLCLFTVGSVILISPFLTAIFFAGTMALAIYPLQRKLEMRGLERKRASFLLTFLFGIIISIPFSFFIAKGTIEVTQQLEKFQTDARYKGEGVQSIVKNVRKSLIVSIQKYADKVGLEQFFNERKIEGHLDDLNAVLLRFFQNFVSQLPTMFLFFLIMLICTYSFLKKAHAVKCFFQDIFGFDDTKMDHLVRIFITDSRQVYVSNIVTGTVQSLCVATGVAVLGLGEFFLVFFITLILAFIPVIGAAPIAFFFGVVAFFRDETTAAIVIVLVGIFAGVIDNVLRPLLATHGESKIPPVPAFVCVIGGALLFGFAGLFIGLLVGAIAYDTLPIFWAEFAKRPDRKIITANNPLEEKQAEVISSQLDV